MSTLVYAKALPSDMAFFPPGFTSTPGASVPITTRNVAAGQDVGKIVVDNLDDALFIAHDALWSLPQYSQAAQAAGELPIPLTLRSPSGIDLGSVRYLGPAGSFVIDVALSVASGESLLQAGVSSGVGFVASVAVTDVAGLALTAVVGVALGPEVIGVGAALGIAFAASVIGGVVGNLVNKGTDFIFAQLDKDNLNNRLIASGNNAKVLSQATETLLESNEQVEARLTGNDGTTTSYQFNKTTGTTTVNTSKANPSLQDLPSEMKSLAQQHAPIVDVKNASGSTSQKSVLVSPTGKENFEQLQGNNLNLPSSGNTPGDSGYINSGTNLQVPGSTLQNNIQKQANQDSQQIKGAQAGSQSNPILSQARITAGVANIPPPVYPPRPDAIEVLGSDSQFHYFVRVLTYDANGNLASKGKTIQTDYGTAQIYAKNTQATQGEWIKQAQSIYKGYADKVAAFTGSAPDSTTPGAPNSNAGLGEVYNPLPTNPLNPLGGSFLPVPDNFSQPPIDVSQLAHYGQFITTANGQTVVSPVFQVGTTFYPLILDLDGNGIDTIDVTKSNIYFDQANNGFANHTGWVGANDGLLAVDTNNNGAIDNASELFGGEQLGFQALKVYDSNNDGMVNASDTDFGKLKIWKDSDSNALTDSGELLTLAQAGIASISLSAQDVQLTDNNNPIVQQSSFTKSDGTKGNISDVGFRYDKVQTISTSDITIDPVLLNLPWVRGIGLVKDLAVAATGNSSFINLITSMASQNDSQTVYNSMDDLLKYWAGQQSTNPALMRGPITEIKAAIISKFLNLDLTTIQDSAKTTLDGAYQNLKDVLYLNFISQTSMGQNLGLNYSFALDYINVDSNTVYDRLIQGVSNEKTAFAALIATKALASVGTISVSTLQSHISSSGYGQVLYDYLAGTANINAGSANNDIILATSGADNLNGLSGNDFFVGSAGNDTLNGGAGNDTYTFDRGDGSDTILEASGTDTVLFGPNVKLSDLQFFRNTVNGVLSNDLQIHIIGTQDTLTIGNWYTSGNNQLESFVFQTAQSINGGTAKTSFTSAEILALLTSTYQGVSPINGTTGNDRLVSYTNAVINGNAGNDSITSLADSTIAGGAGNDTLNGSVGNDTYVFASGFGTDVINDNGGSNTLDISAINGNKTVSTSDISYTESTGNIVTWNGDGITNITTGSGNDSLTGDVGNNALNAGAGNNTLTGGGGNDTYVAGAGNDSISAGSGNDTYKITASGLTSITDAGGSDTLDFSSIASGLTIDLTTTSETLAPQSETPNQKALLNLNSQSNGSTNLADYFGNTWTAVGNAQVSNTSPWKTGENSIIFDGSGDYIKTNSVSLSTDNWTVHLKARFNNAANPQDLIKGFATYSLQLELSGGKIVLNNSSNGSSWNITPVTGTTTFANNQWYDFELNYSSTGGYKLFVDGNLELSSSNTAKTYIDSSNPGLIFGAWKDGSTYPLAGAMSDLYVDTTKNVHTSSFTPSTNNSLSLFQGTVDWSQATGGIENAIGTSGNDSITGTSGNNILNGSAGNDTVTGSGGNDTFIAGTGNDSLVAGSGNDTYKITAFDSFTITDAGGNDSLDFSGLNTGLTIDLTSTAVALPPQSSTVHQKALLNINSQSNGSTSLADYFGNTWTALGNAQVSNVSPWKTGENSIIFDGSGDSIRTNSVSLNTDNWTVHLKTRFNNTANPQDLIKGFATYSLQLELSGGKIVLNNSSNGSSWNITAVTGTTTFLNNQWYDFELNYSSTAGYKLFVDGNLELSSSNTAKTYIDSSNPGLIFGIWKDGSTYPLAGAMSDIYVDTTRNVHTSSFTPSTNNSLSLFQGSVDWSQATGGIENALGTSGNDTITGTSGNNLIVGGAGNDSLTGAGGNDIYQFAAGFGTDTINDSAGTDTLDFSPMITAVSVSLAGTSFSDGNGNSVTWSGSTLENLTTGSGGDSLTGTSASNVLAGGTGNDTYLGFTGTFGTDTINDAGGTTDTANLSTLASTSATWTAQDTNSDGKVDQLTVDFGSGNKAIVSNYFDNTSSNVRTSGAGTGTIETFIFSDDANFTFDKAQNKITGATSATTGNDSLPGTAGADSIDGLAGNDIILALAANDTLIGNTGNDSLDGGDGDDLYQFASGFGVDTIVDSSGSDTLSFSAYTTAVNASLANTSFTDSSNTVSWTAAALENLVGGSGNNTLTGNDQANSITGGSGNDTLNGAAGNDTLNGSSGNDTYAFSSGFGIDSVLDSAGVDQLNFSTYTTDLSISLANTSLSDSLGNSVTWQQDAMENASGGSGNDSLMGNASANLLTGNNGNDTFNGAAGNDTLDGGAGNDLYQFSTGFSTDSIADASGNDTIDLSTFSTNLSVDLTSTSFTQSTGNSIAWSANTLENILAGSGSDTLTGTSGNNSFTGGSGNDSLSTSAGNDTLNGGAGNDTLVGGADNDSYTGFSSTSGNDVITDSAGASDSADFTGLKTSQVSWTAVDTNADGKIDQLKADMGGGNSALINNYFDNTGTSAGASGQGSGLIESLIFDDDTSVTFSEVQGFINPSTATSGNDLLKGTTGNDSINALAGNDTIFAFAGNDSLTGGLGNDSIDGGDGDDTYVFASGFGTDTIVDASGSDKLDFSAYTTNLTLSLAGTSVSDGSNTVNWTVNTIENITTGSGNDALTGNALNNSLSGGDGTDSFIGSDGNDSINGGNGTDTLSYGDTSIKYATNNTVAHNGYLDTLSSVETLQAGLATNDQILATNNTTAVTVNLTTGSISGGNGSATSISGFENIQGSAFNDSLTGNSSANLLEGLAGNDSILGLDGDDSLFGTDGADTLDGGSGNDALDGGNDNDSLLGGIGDDSLTGASGNDVLKGGDGNDGYLAFSKTSGADTINDSSGTDFAVFAGAKTTDATFSALDSDSNGMLDDLKIDFGSGNSVLIQNYFSNDNGDIGNTASGAGYIESLKFDDAPNLAVADIKALLSQKTGNSGADTLSGSEADDTLSGGSGNDSLTAYGGSDILYGGDGTDTLDAGNGDDTLSGDAGNDSLIGGDGDDFYAFGEGFGTDTIVDTLGTNTISFSSALSGASSPATSSSVSVNLSTKTATSGANSVTWTGSTITNIAGGNGSDALIGDSNDNSITDDLGNDSITGGAGNDDLSGGTGNDTYKFASSFGMDTIFNETDGSDTLDFSAFTTTLTIDLTGTAFTQSTGNSVSWDAGTLENLISGSANDTLTGTASDNLLIGNAGNDSLIGGAGNDSYQFAAGFGTDTINDASGSDTIDFSAFGTGLTINLGNTSFTQSTGNTVNWSSNAIENVVGGSGADSLTGNSSDNKLTGGAGNDTLSASSGNDTYVFGSGFGTDSVSDSAGNDTLDFSAFSTALSISLAGTTFTQSSGNTVTWSGIENLITGSGNDSLTGSTGDNILTGGAGNDTLNGGTGNDTYKFGLGFGTDTLVDFSGTDTLDLTAYATNVAANLGLNSYTESAGNTVSWSAGIVENLSTGSGNDTLSGSSGNNLLSGGLGDDTYAFSGTIGVDTISDALGNNTLDLSAYSDVSLNLASTTYTQSVGNTITWTTGNIENITTGTGNDNLTGNSNNNRFDSGAGNDTMSGGAGDDTYILRSGFGIDSISDSAGTDTLDLSNFTQGAAVDLAANTFINNGSVANWTGDVLDNLLLSNANDSAGGNDNANLITAQAGNDTINGAGGNDTLIGGAGNDSIEGGDGDDTFQFNLGDGNDTISDSNGTDTLILGANITADNISFKAVGVNGDDLLIEFDSSRDSILLKNQLSDTLPPAIDTLEFADSSTMSSIDMMVNLQVLGKYDTPDYVETLTGSRHNENLFGIGGPDILYGMGGEDVLHGEYGADTLYGGDGSDKLFGEQDDDTLYGGSGTNTYFFEDGWGHDLINSESITDIADLSSVTSDLNVIMWSTNDPEVTDGTNTVNWDSPIFNIRTGSGNDSINGDGASNSVSSGSGDDTIYGWDGDDTLNGETGNDSLDGGNGANIYIFNNDWGNDTINSSSSSDYVDLRNVTSDLEIIMWSTSGDEVTDGLNTINWDTPVRNILAGSGNDLINGDGEAAYIAAGAGNDTIYGWDGNDILDGGSDNDSLDGGNGANSYVFKNNWGNDTINNSSSGDYVDLSGVTSDLTVTLESSAGTEISDGINTVNWNNPLYSIQTGSGNDIVTGGTGGEYISTGDGDDTLVANAGNDYLVGGTGTNTYVFSNGWGNDVIDNSSTMWDIVDLSGVTSDLTVTMWSSWDNEVTDGTNTIDWYTPILNIRTGSGGDTINGDGDSDFISTGSGSDIIYAADGNDTLIGGTGNDTLYGGNGNDIYQFGSGDGNDLISDNGGTSDTIAFESSVSLASIGLYQDSSGNLHIGYGSSGDNITIQDQDTTNGAIERLQTSDGHYLTNADINGVIQAMSSYATNNSVTFTSLSDVENNANLMAIVNAAWHTS